MLIRNIGIQNIAIKKNKKKLKKKNFEFFFFKKIFKDHFFINTLANLALTVRGELILIYSIAFNSLVLASKKIEIFF